MADVNITVRDNGPYLIKGGVIVMDADGKQYESKEVIALCRCGHSANKPFCDGQHNAQSFQSAPRAPQA